MEKTTPKTTPKSPTKIEDKYLPPERVTAELLSPETLRCQPTQPAAPSGIDTIEAWLATVKENLRHAGWISWTYPSK